MRKTLDADDPVAALFNQPTSQRLLVSMNEESSSGSGSGSGSDTESDE